MMERSAATTIGGAWAGLERLISTAIHLIWLNTCWLGLTLLGAILVGILPATTAGHRAARRLQTHPDDPQIASTMWGVWRQHLGKGAVLGVIMHLWAGSIAATWWLSTHQSVMTAAISQGVASIGGLLWLVIASHLPWVIGRTNLSVPRTLLAALAAGMGRPLLTLALLITGIGWPVLLVILGWPALLLVLGASLPLAVQSWCVLRVFPEQHSDRTDP